MKGKVRIVGALVVGIVIILGSLYVSKRFAPQAPQAPTGEVVAIGKAELREQIDTKDSNGDGIPDWQETLNEKVFKSITAPSSTSPYGSGEPYTPPTTLTGKFSEAFLADYLEGKMAGEDFSDTASFVNRAVSSVESNTQSKKHTRAELTIISGDTEAVRNYGNQLIDIVNTYTHKGEHEMVVFQDAMLSDNEERLSDLKPVQRSYEDIITHILIMPVPDTLSNQHIALINVCEAMLADIKAFQLAFSDPLYALARFNAYPSDSEALYAALKSIADTINQNGIVYSQNEPGAFFYMFDAI